MRNIKRIIILLFLFVFLITLVSCSAGNKKYDLKLKYKTGEVYELEIVIEQRHKLELVHLEDTLDVYGKITTKFIETVEEIDADGNILIHRKYDAIKSIQKNGPLKIEYDSENLPDEIPQIVIPFHDLIGLEFKKKINEKGEILEVFEIEEILKKRQAKLKKRYPDLDEMILEKMMEGIEKNYAPENLGGPLKHYSVLRQDKPISVGYKWIAEVKTGPPLPIIIETEYHFKEKKNDILLIVIKSTFESSPESEQMKNMWIYNVKGTESGIIKIDKDTGIIVDSKIYRRIEGTVTMKIKDEDAICPMLQETTIIIRTKKVK